MIGFFIKKAFFDAWDNLIGLVISNLGFVIIFVLFFIDLGQYIGVKSINLIFMIIALLAFSFHNVGVAKNTFAYSNYKREGFEGYSEGLRLFWRHGIALFLINVFLIILAIFVIPFYYSMSNILGFVVSILLIWVLFSFILAMQYFLPLMVNFTGDKPIKTLKKSFIMFIGNLSFSLFLLFFNTIQVILTILTAGLLFSGSGIMLANMDAFKLLLLKIDYLEVSKEIKFNKSDWDYVLYEEKKSVGDRTLKGMIFPWKD